MTAVSRNLPLSCAALLVLSAGAAVCAIPPSQSAQMLLSYGHKGNQGHQWRGNNGSQGYRDNKGSKGNKSNNGVRDHGRGEGRNGAGQGKGQGQKNKYR